MTSLSLDVVIRGAGSIRSPSDHLAAIRAEVGGSRVIVAEGVADTGALAKELDAAADEHLLIYGEEWLLALLENRPVGTIWLTVAAGVNPLRGVWRLRGGYPWVASADLGLILEDPAAGDSIGSSQLLKTGRIARVATLGPDAAREVEAAEAAVAAAEEIPVIPDGEPLTGEVVESAAEPAPQSDEPAPEPEQPVFPGAEPDLPAEDVALPVEPHDNVADAPPAEEGVSEEMSKYPYSPTAAAAMVETEQNTEQAILNRYTLVKERRNLLPKLAQTEDIITGLLKEIFVTRYTAGPEAAGVFQELTGKLAQAAQEYKELSETLARVEKQLEELAWLKTELEM